MLQLGETPRHWPHDSTFHGKTPATKTRHRVKSNSKLVSVRPMPALARRRSLPFPSCLPRSVNPKGVRWLFRNPSAILSSSRVTPAEESWRFSKTRACDRSPRLSRLRLAIAQTECSTRGAKSRIPTRACSRKKRIEGRDWWRASSSTVTCLSRLTSDEGMHI